MIDVDKPKIASRPKPQNKITGDISQGHRFKHVAYGGTVREVVERDVKKDRYRLGPLPGATGVRTWVSRRTLVAEYERAD